MKTRYRFAFILLTVVACISPLVIAGSNEAVGTSATVAQEDRVSPQEAQAFAKQWIQAVQQRDFDAIGQLVDWDYITGKVIEPFDVADDFREGFMSGAQQLPRQMVPPMSIAVNQGGSYQLVNVRNRGQEVHAVFRLVLPNDGGMNYHDFRLKKRDNKVFSDQMFVALSGETISDSMRRAVLPILKSAAQESGEITAEMQAAFKETEMVSEMSTAMAQGDSAKVLGMYEMLSPEMKRNKLCQIYRIAAFPAEKDPDQYIKLVDQYAKQFPSDPSLGLITMDSAIFREDTASLKRSHDQVIEWAGKDPYVSLMVGAALVAIGAPEEGIKLAAGSDPDPLKIAAAHNYQLAIDLAGQNYDGALKQLRILRDRFKLDLSQIEQTESFAGFIKSPQYQQFKSD